MAVVALGAVVLAATLAGCAGGSSAAPASPCRWTPPPSNPGVPAPECGASPGTITAPLRHGADLLPVTIELYTDRELSCSGAAGCAVEDDRPYLAAGAAAPLADPTRSRVTITLDWQAHQATLRVAPRCHIPSPPAGQVPARQTCITPAAAFHTDTVPSAHAPWRFDLDATVPGDPGEAPVATVHDHWAVALDPTTGALDVTGDGTDSPAFALLDLGVVACADPGLPYPAPARPASRHYSCHAQVPPNP